MNRKRETVVWLLGLLLALFLVGPAAAGNWVVVTFESLPETIRAGETVTLDFIVRQHGETPLDGLAPTLTAFNQETGERMTATATATAVSGRYMVSLVFPEAGRWAWELATPPFNQKSQYEPLTVLPAAPAPLADGTAPVTIAESARIVLRWLGVALLALGVLLPAISVWRRRQADVLHSPS